MKETYTITGMTCSGCATTVKRLLSNVKGVHDAQVSLVENSAEVVREEHVTLDALKIALRVSL